MKRAYVSSQGSKIGEGLKGFTQVQVSDYKQRFNVVIGMYDEFLKGYMIFLHRHFLNHKFFIGIPIKNWLKNLERMSKEKY